MSKESRKELMNAIQWLTLFSPLHKTYDNKEKRWKTFKVNFITLTLAQEQMHSDGWIKKHMLEPFLKWMARQGAISYIWKAETQNNGNIHFHITTNYYLPWQSVRNKWNSLQYNHGYLKNYFEEHGHHDVNGTDIKSVKNMRDLASDLAKYAAKLEFWCKRKDKTEPTRNMEHPSRYIDDYTEKFNLMPVPRRQVEGRKWATSNNLVGLRCFVTDMEPEFMETTSQFLNSQEYRHLNMDFADIWFYPHLLEGKAPPRVVEKLKQLKRYVMEYRDN